MCLCSRVSSANLPRMESRIESSLVKVRGGGFINKMNSIGPNTEPWGTPLITRAKMEGDPSTQTV